MTKIGHSFDENNFSARSDALSAGVFGFVFRNELLCEFRHGVWFEVCKIGSFLLSLNNPFVARSPPFIPVF
jgi:hypothetical protein